MTMCSECKGIGGSHLLGCSRPDLQTTTGADVPDYVRSSTNQLRAAANKHDPVNHPSHYTQYQGLEIIDLTEQMNFNRGNAVKYIARAGLKNPDTEIEDLEKAVWYTQREIDRIKNRP